MLLVNMKNNENINVKAASSTGSMSTIMIMNNLDEICLGDQCLKMALHLRETNFIIIILLNLSMTNIEDLESAKCLLVNLLILQ